MSETRFTCAFTGHRKIENQEELRKKLCDLIEELYCEHGIRHFVAGGALGFDTLCAECTLALREKYPDVTLEIAMPCENQTRGWKSEDIKKYEKIKECANATTLVSKAYFSGCMHKRNRYMIDKSSVCVAYLSKSTGGTAYTVKYAESLGVKVINLYE